MDKKLSLDEIYEKLDALAEKEHRKDADDYFPEVEEINTYLHQEDPAVFIPYLIYLDENLSPEGRQMHSDALKLLYKITDEYCE